MIIAVDFDGTCVTHDYPEIGEPIGAYFVLKALIDEGHQLILWTMRSGSRLDEAVQWFKDQDLPLYGVNNNPKQSTWTDSPKAHAHLYIDDAALGIPLKYNKTRPCVDWSAVCKMLRERGILSDTET